jgi:hypothetical protein
LVLYRPGTGTIRIQQNANGVFSPVYHEGDPGNGIGGYDLKSPADRVFAFDYNGSGKLDHLVLYRPGTGTIWILEKNVNGVFSPVYHEGDPGNGIGGYDLKSPADRVFAFDYNGSGKLDHLVLYRPGTGTIWILEKNVNGVFSPVYHEGDPVPPPSRRLKRRLFTKRKQHCGKRKGPCDIWAEGKTKVLGATRMHWADRRASAAVPDSLSDARTAGDFERAVVDYGLIQLDGAVVGTRRANRTARRWGSISTVA